MNVRPEDTEFAPYYKRYVSLVPENNVLEVLDNQLADLRQVAGSVTPEREIFRYAAGKWSIREILGHMIDAERVFGYRAYCFSRGEQAHLPSFDQNMYVERSRYDSEPLASLLSEFDLVRKGNLTFLERLHVSEWERQGMASDNMVSVRALAFIMVGHVRHHINVLRDRYGLPAAG